MSIGARHLPVLLLILLLPSCQVTTGSPRMTIPVTLNAQNKILLPSDLGPAILDTGAAISMVDAAFAKRHHLRSTGDTATARDVTGATAEVSLAVIPKLTIPAREPGRSWELHDLEVVVIPNMKNTAWFGSTFILGMPVFEDRIVELDLPKSEIRLLRHLPFGLNCTTVHLKVAESGGGGTPGIPVRFRGVKPFHGTLDTGYSDYLSLSTPAWEQIPIRKGSEKTGLGGGFLADRSFKKARAAADVTVGNVTIKNSPIAQSHGSEWRHTLIGASVWKHTTIAIDWNRKKAVFRTPWTFLNHHLITFD